MPLLVPSCGCLPGSDISGWMEIRSTYCLAAEKRQFGLAVLIAKRITDEIARKQLLDRLNRRLQ